MTRHLMLAYAVMLAALAGSTGHEWAVLVPLPHLTAWVWLGFCANPRAEIDENAPQIDGAMVRYRTSGEIRP